MKIHTKNVKPGSDFSRIFEEVTFSKYSVNRLAAVNQHSPFRKRTFPARRGHVHRMESEHLRLRQANQDLLQRLRVKQEEIRKSLPSKPLLPASLCNRATAEASVPLPKRGKENQVDRVCTQHDPATLVSVEPRACTARAALCSSLKHSSNDRGVQQQTRMQESVLQSCFPAKEKNLIPVPAVITCERETCGLVGDSHAQGSAEADSFLLGREKNRRQTTLPRGSSEKNDLRGHLDPSANRVQSEETSKEATTPKSILLTSQSKGLKEAGRVTFQAEPDEYTVPVSSWSVRPFLGYDWIAGLLDTNSSVEEKSDQYFAELHEFRQANKEACVSEQHMETEPLECIIPEQDLIASSHKCVYCYRLNRRLFPVPMDSDSACPVCKVPRTHQPPETLEEPAYVRVSIPRSTLMPAYKYKAHCRKSFEPADSLALPLHCLVGWENTIPSSDPTVSSLDLQASLKEKPHHSLSPEPGVQSVRRSQN
ncbi:migration and invasion-inhibitory protein isoform X2 [Tympanuchus pallidicinctus]|uniref:migration and invasion-inhibitory protein isoform X2 n=1 Tax=Tympanuchus pallidicinctus TaxID=109042 RepID=UPI002287406D|nr:migration and invasion-inhibitory protein isoform X2 [Tympanuchus pallidicinctus]